MFTQESSLFGVRRAHTLMVYALSHQAQKRPPQVVHRTVGCLDKPHRLDAVTPFLRYWKTVSRYSWGASRCLRPTHTATRAYLRDKIVSGCCVVAALCSETLFPGGLCQNDERPFFVSQGVDLCFLCGLLAIPEASRLWWASGIISRIALLASWF